MGPIPLRPRKEVDRVTYKLRKNTTKGLFEDSGISEGKKEDHNVYLLISQWNELDKLAEETGKSRNQVIRDLISYSLDQVQNDSIVVEDGWG